MVLNKNMRYVFTQKLIIIDNFYNYGFKFTHFQFHKISLHCATTKIQLQIPYLADKPDQFTINKLNA